MAERYLFFNSQLIDGEYDREYEATDFADYFRSLLSEGLINTDDELGMVASVEPGTLNTKVSAGKAIIKGHLYENTSDLTLEHPIPEASLDRLDRIVLRLDLRNQSRYIKLFVKEGVSAADPVPPELQRDNFIYELSLAQVRVRANTSSIDPSDLYDERLIDELCGIVTWIPSLPTGKFQEQWDEFMDSVKDEGYATLTMLNNVEGELSGRIDGVIEDYVRSPGYASASHTGNVYNVSLNPAPIEYRDGMGIVLKATNNTTGIPKVNVNGLGTKGILQTNGLEVPAFKSNTVYTLRYNGTAFILQGEGGSDVDRGKIVGSIALDVNGLGKVDFMDDLYYYASKKVGDNFIYNKINKSNGALISSVTLAPDVSPISDHLPAHNPNRLIVRHDQYSSLESLVYDDNKTLIIRKDPNYESINLFIDNDYFLGYQLKGTSYGNRNKYFNKYNTDQTIIESFLVSATSSTNYLYIGDLSSIKYTDGEIESAITITSRYGIPRCFNLNLNGPFKDLNYDSLREVPSLDQLFLTNMIEHLYV